MAEQVVVQPESLLNLDDLLQCPVCYEIPSGQIFQCNEGHHVCGRCKARLDVCPVCRALFFGTRNYAMEELIANFKKLKAFKVGGKQGTGSGSSESSTPARDTVSAETENDAGENNSNESNQITLRVPQACKGLFRCLCCKNGNAEKLPAARLLNHLRYFHSPDLIEGQSEFGEYVQAWEFSTGPGRIVTAVRVSDMGIYFLVIDIDINRIYAWLTMAASPSVANTFSYTLTLSGSDREAIFTDCVLSVRSCEGTLKKRGHALVVTGLNAIALTSTTALNAKLCLRRTPPEQLAHQTQPRAVMRVATRGNNRDNSTQDISPPTTTHTRGDNVIQDLYNETVNLRTQLAALQELGNEDDNDYPLALVRAFTSIRMANRIAEDLRDDNRTRSEEDTSPSVASPAPPAQPMSRNARRRMRQRLRMALNDDTPAPAPPSAQVSSRSNLQNGHVQIDIVPQTSAPHMPQTNLSNGPSTSAANAQNENQTRNKKKRRHRR
ncbi:uncharacterized protein LOC106712294 [Papilio machaon]|uniref:uncharacterized protein LOC106712294 n=1 Tax=Papilio machaon TaxID=76193 RepID=UPI001E6660F7|nr:uncharacterized protein LOC106712294 [Papilio machaon]